MEKDFRSKAIILPIVLGIILGVAFFFFMNSTDYFYPLPESDYIAYHDVKSDKSKKVDADNVQPNDYVGTIELKNKSINVIYDADYSNLVSAVSINPEKSIPSQAGCSFVYAFSANAADFKSLSADDTISLKSVWGDFKYKFVSSYDEKSEYSLLSRDYNISNGLVIYCEKSESVGFTSGFDVYLFEEV